MKWISVLEELPEIGEPVIILTYHKTMYIACRNESENSENYPANSWSIECNCYVGSSPGSKVMYWMELPDLPEEL